MIDSSIMASTGPIPEPMTLALLGAGLIGIGICAAAPLKPLARRTAPTDRHIGGTSPSLPTVMLRASSVPSA